MRSGFSWVRETVHMAQDYVQRRVDLVGNLIFYHISKDADISKRIVDAQGFEEGRVKSYPYRDWGDWGRKKKIVAVKEFSFEEGCAVMRMPRPNSTITRTLKFFMGYRNMLTCERGLHDALRKPHEKFFHKRTVAEDFGLVEQIARRFIIEKMHIKTDLNGHYKPEFIVKFTLQVIIAKTFNLDPENDEEQLDQLTEAIYKSIALPEANLKLLTDFNAMQKKVQEVLERHYAPGLGKAEKLSSTFMFLMAGMHTTSHTIRFMICEMARHPKLLERLEIESKESNSFEEFVKKNEFMEHCFLEILRLYPIFPIMLRKADRILDFDTTRVNKGDLIALDIGAMQRREEVWGEDPDKYDPTRWKRHRLKKQQLLSFGKGPMQCIGQHLARIEAKTFVALYFFTRPVDFLSQYLKYTNAYNGAFLSCIEFPCHTAKIDRTIKSIDRLLKELKET